MSQSLIALLGGLTLLLGGQRLAADVDIFGPLLTLSGLLVLGASVGLRVRDRKSAAGPALAAHTKALLLTGGALLAVLLYFVSTPTSAEFINLSDEGVKRWTVAFGALWPIVLVVCVAPLALIDLAIEDSPKVVQPVRIQQALDNGLIGALGLALVFPLNFLASEHNERWDLAYFKTTEPGTSTLALVANLTEPVHVRIFQPNSSDVTPELRPYFESLAEQNPAFTVEILDHAAEPLLSKELKVRDNGYIALTSGDGTEDAVTKSWKIGTDLDKAKRNLKKLDEEFQKRLLDLAKGDRVAYFTVGHGEFNWKVEGDLPDDKISGMKTALQNLNFKVKLGLAQGLGSAVPDDAGIVFVLGPNKPFQQAELDTLKAYVDNGGALLVAVEPDQHEADALLEHLGLRLGEGRLATKTAILRRTGDKTDRLNLVTDRYSSHESTSTLSKFSRQLPLFVPGAGWLEASPDHRGQVTVTVRSLPDVFADLDGDLELDSETETEEIRALAAVASGPANGQDADGNPLEYRAIVTADATMFSDLTIANQANQQYIYDGVNWLLGEEELSGTVESEEDIKIEHTQEGQKSIFYATSLGLPLLLLLLGVARVRGRKKAYKPAGGAA